MQSLQFQSLQTVCKRYGPGRLPKADEHDIGAGYAAAAAAFVATVLYGTVTSIGAVLGMGVEGAVNLLFAAIALPFVVPAAFFVGVVCWRLLPSYSSTTGVIAGGLGAIATYVIAFLLVGTLITVAAMLSLSGADPMSAAAFSVGFVAAAFYFTWWVTIPIGCLSGFLYVNIIDAAN